MVEMLLDVEKVWYKEERAARLKRDSLNRSEAESELFKADHGGMLGQHRLNSNAPLRLIVGRGSAAYRVAYCDLPLPLVLTGSWLGPMDQRRHPAHPCQRSLLFMQY